MTDNSQNLSVCISISCICQTISIVPQLLTGLADVEGKVNTEALLHQLTALFPVVT